VNLPHKIGERYTCFVVEREDQGWGGPYGQTRRPTRWRCESCGYLIRGDLDGWPRKQMADHHECGHAPCEHCGQPLLRRKDGTPRQHAHHRCPGKNPGFKIDREFAKNIARREYA
jgi:hypothetical protein